MLFPCSPPPPATCTRWNPRAGDCIQKGHFSKGSLRGRGGVGARGGREGGKRAAGARAAEIRHHQPPLCTWGQARPQSFHRGPRVEATPPLQWSSEASHWLLADQWARRGRPGLSPRAAAALDRSLGFFLPVACARAQLFPGKRARPFCKARCQPLPSPPAAAAAAACPPGARAPHGHRLAALDSATEHVHTPLRCYLSGGFLWAVGVTVTPRQTFRGGLSPRLCVGRGDTAVLTIGGGHCLSEETSWGLLAPFLSASSVARSFPSRLPPLVRSFVPSKGGTLLTSEMQ